MTDGSVEQHIAPGADQAPRERQLTLEVHIRKESVHGCKRDVRRVDPKAVEPDAAVERERTRSAHVGLRSARNQTVSEPKTELRVERVTRPADHERTRHTASKRDGIDHRAEVIERQRLERQLGIAQNPSLALVHGDGQAPGNPAKSVGLVEA